MPGPDTPSQVAVRLMGRLSWKRWEDEVVVYDDASGHTHLLEANAAEALTCLEQMGGLCRRADFARQLAERLAVQDDEQEDFEGWLEAVLARFRRMDLLVLELNP
ncbi:hypothetical protein JCM17960_31390 [Magnetospira thiophila]